MKTYTYAGIAEGDRESGYGLYFPDIDGCVTAADTLEQLAAMAREALSLHLEGMLEAGQPLPPATAPDALPHDPEIVEAGVLLVTAVVGDRATDVQVELPASLLDRVDRAAQARQTTRSAILEASAEAFLKVG